MPSIDIVIPYIGQEVLVSFKEPFNTYIKNKYNWDTLTKKLVVVSVISLVDLIRSDLRDPYSEIYIPAGVSEVEYKKDLQNEIPLISFKFKDVLNVDRYFRVPLNYINAIENIFNIEYINKLIVIDLNRLPMDYDTVSIFSELADFIETHIGIKPQLKTVELGDIEMVDDDEHTLRETVRNNMVKVHKTQSIQLEELKLKYNQILERLKKLNIILG